MTIPNTITLDALRHMAVGDIAALHVEELARLQADADEALRDAKSLRDWLEGAGGAGDTMGRVRLNGSF